MANKKKKITQWFVRPLNPHTNQVIAREVPGEDFMDVEDGDGKKFKAWLVDHAFLSMIRGFGPFEGIKFKVYSRQNNFGPVRLNNFTAPKRFKRSVKFKKAKKDLEKVTIGHPQA